MRSFAKNGVSTLGNSFLCSAQFVFLSAFLIFSVVEVLQTGDLVRSLSKGSLSPLSQEEQQLLQSLLLRANLTQPKEKSESAEGSVVTESGWSVMHEAMTDASKRRMAESPPREARDLGYALRSHACSTTSLSFWCDSS